jgi:hypothetical protein
MAFHGDDNSQDRGSVYKQHGYQPLTRGYQPQGEDSIPLEIPPLASGLIAPVSQAEVFVPPEIPESTVEATDS